MEQRSEHTLGQPNDSDGNPPAAGINAAGGRADASALADSALAADTPTGSDAADGPQPTPADFTHAMRRWLADVAIAAGAFLFGWGQLMLTASSIIIQDVALRQYLGTLSITPSPQVVVALALTVLPVVFRRIAPWTVFATSTLAFLVAQSYFAGISFMAVGPMVALYTIAFQKGLPKAVVAGVTAGAAIFVLQDPDQALTLAFFTRFQNIALLAASLLAGWAMRTRNAYVRAVEERAEAAERTREEEAAKRVEAERVLIAREVHDITAHSLSAVSIQAAAAERLIDTNPAAAKEAIATVRATSRQALGDIRSMIGVLRHGDEPAERTPAQGTDQLEDIANYLRGAGLTVTFDESGYHRDRVPAHVDMALFGIAREASTNIVKHGGATAVNLMLESSDDNATLVIHDNGRGAGVALESSRLPEARDGQGHGIQGMAERVHVLGGIFHAGDDADGFTVEAIVPFERE